VGVEQEHDLGGNEWSTSNRYFTHIEMALPLTLRPLLRCPRPCPCPCPRRPRPRHRRPHHHRSRPCPCPCLPLHHLHLFSEYVR
jgi:hypothetical protein